VTYLSRALALTMANDLDTSVCAVELNWWWPDKTLELPADHLGLAGVLSGEIQLEEAIVNTSQPNLSILPAGRMPVASRPTFSRGIHLKEILYQLNEQYEYIILDIPAISVTNDSIPLASLGDACCLVIQQGITPVEKVRTALDEIDHQKFLGVILNNARFYTPSFLINLIPQDATPETNFA
jgi:Mrp family chromosome partitioning ATPase